MQVMYRASVAPRKRQALILASGWSGNRWNIPVLFRSRDEAIRAACKAAKRKIEQHGGEWSIDIQRERVVII